jgi:hypothetical protein
MTPYKFGAILALLLVLITIPMFATFEELTVLIPINILMIGVPLLILYYIFVFIYLTFSKRVFFICLIIILAIPLYLITKEMYNEYSYNKKYEEWDNSPITGEYEIGNDITVPYSENQNNLFKYKIVIPKSGTLLIKSEPHILEDLLVLKVFNSKKPDNWIVSRPTESGIGIDVDIVKENEIYFLVIDQTRLNKSGTGSYIIKSKITESR